MADYYSILKKTIASLPESNGAARRSVYSRARNAIVNQLKAYEPPLSPSEITSEQLRLEEAIRKVEAEAARESLGLGTPSASATSALVSPPPVQAQPVSSVVEPSVEPQPASAQTSRQVAEATAAPSISEPAQTPSDNIPSPLKETLSEAQSLGTAANKAVQNAKDVIEPVGPVSSSFSVSPDERKEPAFDTAPAVTETQPAKPQAANFQPEPAMTSPADDDADEPEESAPASRRSKRSAPSASEALRGEKGNNRFVPVLLAGVLALVVAGAGGYFLLSGQGSDETVPAGTSDARVVAAPETSPEPAVSAPETVSSENASEKNTDRLIGADPVAPDARTVTTTTINPQSEETPPDQSSVVTNIESSPVPETPAIVSDTTSTTDETTPPAVSTDSLAAVSPEPAAPTASTSESSSVQRSILYEEGEESGGAGTAAQGAVTWSLEEETGLDGQARTVLSAVVQVPERDVKVDVRIKPNDDTSLPASHLVEIKYELPDGFAAGDIVNVPGLVMKPTEEARGDALIGASVKVSPGYFWIALSSLPNEQQRNLNLLRERGWIDIPMLYENGKRGILTLEKGAAGTDAVNKAVGAWTAG